jgi:hypothetical protein
MRVRVSLDFDILIESCISLCIIETVLAIFREYKRYDIVYLDETWVNQNHCTDYMWLPNDGSDAPKIPSGKGKRLIILHVGTRSESLIDGCALSFILFGLRIYYVMSADFKLCIKCDKLINILDDHDDCYRHRVCNSEFPCEFYDIVYMDETWVNQNHCTDYMWLPNDGSDAPKIPSGKGKRLIILHVGTRSESLIDGCALVFLAKSKDGDYHQEMIRPIIRKPHIICAVILVNPCFIHVHDIIPCFPKRFGLSQIITPIIDNRHFIVHNSSIITYPCKSNRPKERATILDDFDHCVIKRTIHGLYSRKIAKTVSYPASLKDLVFLR